MSIAESNAAWAQIFASHLARAVVMSPGSRNTPLVLALTARPDAEVHCILDERAAGFFALGLARSTRRAVVLVCTSGSAGAHYLPALIEASSSAVPLIVLTADRPPELQRCGASQTVDQNRLFGVHVRWFADVGAPHGEVSRRWLRTLIAQALDRAEGSEPGPVHINLPFREPLWDNRYESPQPPDLAPARISRGKPHIDDGTLAALARRLTAQPRGIVVAGVRATHPNDQDMAIAVHELAQRLGWPVLAEPTSQLRRNALAGTLVTTYDALLRDEAFAAAHAPQLILRLGQFPTSKVCGQWLGRYGTDHTILIDPHGAWHDPTHAADLLVVAEPCTVARALLSHLEPRRDHAWLKSWQAAEAQARARLDALCAEEFSEPAIAVAVAQSLPTGGALCVASSMPIRDIDSFAPATDLTYFANRGANGIDGTLASALGTACGWRQGPTAVILGDLAFLHDVGALHLARQLRIALTAVVINNGGGGIFDFLPIAKHPTAFQDFFRTPQDADLASLAQAAGAQVNQVSSLPALRHALAEGWQRPGLNVIEAKVVPGTNVHVHEAAWRAARVSSRPASTGP